MRHAFTPAPPDALMNNLAALIMIVMAGGHPADSRADEARPGEMRAAPRVVLAQAGSPPPGPRNPPSVTPPISPPSAAGAPAPPPKIDSLPDGPPLGSLSLSQLMIKIEGEPEFAYVSAVDWRDGRYAVTFVTRDGQSHEKVLDPRTGREAGRATQTGDSPRNETPQNGAGNTGSGNPVLNPTGTPSNAPATAPRPAGPRQ